jgi:hypothetical protein
LKPFKIIALIIVAQVVFVVLTVLFIVVLRYELRRTPTFAHPPIAPTSSWKRFSSVEGRFSVFFPGTPESTNILTDETTNSALHLFYVDPSAQNCFAIGYSDSAVFSKMAALPDPQAFLKKSEALSVANSQGKVTYEQESKFRDYPAREFEYVAGGKANYSTRMKLILVGDRVYEIYVIFLTQNPYPQERMAFFNSFSLITNQISF